MIKRILLFAVITIISTNITAAEKTIPPYLTKLLTNESYFQAINEIEIQYARKNISENNYHYLTAASYFLGEQYHSAYNISLKTQFNIPEAKKYKENILYLYCGVYSIPSKNWISEIDNSIDIQTDDDNRDDLFALKNIIYLNNFEFNKIYDFSKQYNSKYNTTFSKEIMELSSKYKDINYKSPFLSLSMSLIIPGSGLIYSGKYFNSFISFVSFTLFSGASYYLYNNDYRTESIITGCTSALLYVGSAYASYNAASQHNYEQNKAFYKQLEPKLKNHYKPLKYFFSTEF